MQGSVLNVGAFQGLILGDDGVRYTFTYAEWRDSNVPLQIGVRVVFEVRGSYAVNIYPVPDQPPLREAAPAWPQARSSAQPDAYYAQTASTAPPTRSKRRPWLIFGGVAAAVLIVTGVASLMVLFAPSIAPIVSEFVEGTPTPTATPTPSPTPSPDAYTSPVRTDRVPV